MTTTQQSLREVSKEFSSQHLLKWVLFETNEEEAKRIAPRIGSIAQRIYNLRSDYFNADYGKRNEIRKFMTDNWFKTEWITTNWVEMFNDAKSDGLGMNFIDEILVYLSKMTRVDYTISHSAFHTDSIPHTVVCPSPMGIDFLNIVSKKLKD
jgi:hypothetical protein